MVQDGVAPGIGHYLDFGRYSIFLYNVVLVLFPEPDDAPEKLGQVIAEVMSRAMSRQAPMGWWAGPNA